MTLIEAIDGNGRTRRCDARCHGAKGKTCTCVCGGTMHGCGKNNVYWKLNPGMLEQISRENPDLRISSPGFQLELLDGEN